MAEPEAFVHLHVRSWYSFLRGASSPEMIAARAGSLGQPAIAVTDWMTVAGAVKLEIAARNAGIRPIIGAEVLVRVSREGTRERDEHPLVLLAASQAGYGALCRLLTVAHETRDHPTLEFEALGDDCEGLIALTGGREGRLRDLLETDQKHSALEWVRSLKSTLPGRVFVELSHHRRPGESRLIGRLSNLARVAGLPCVVTNDARHATPDAYATFDLLSCVRLGLSVDHHHPERPVNDEAFVKSRAELEPLIYHPAAYANTLEVARECDVRLLHHQVSPPGAIFPAHQTARGYLRHLCERALPGRVRREQREKARGLLEHELELVGDLDLSEFFLVVHEVIEFARSRSIRCAGRGSAANSMIAYLLSITNVNPAVYPLKFERFLHRGRSETPDIDVDFDSSRRMEVIAWLEARFTREHTAMTANVNTYGLRSAVRDAAKALGWSLEVVEAMTKVLPHYGSCRDVGEHRTRLEGVVGASPLLEVMLESVSRLEGCPRHLSLHSGGMILARDALWKHTPVQVSANGVKQAVFDKEDIQHLGLVKFDVLGLRIMGALAHALEAFEAATGEKLEIDDLDLNEPAVYASICRGEVVGLFQIESPGQNALIAKHQPRNFNDLVAEIALLRPGPLQGNMVHPYIRRRNGEEAITYSHPSLELALERTYGVILYQEQVLEVCHDFAGMSYEESDGFRRLMSKWRSATQMEGMRERFVAGALEKHGDLSRETANLVFDQVSKFVGYGFPGAHSTAFALTAFQTAWFRLHHPAAYFAGVMQHRPGMYPLQTLIEEARSAGVTVLPPRLEVSSLQYGLERSLEAQPTPSRTRGHRSSRTPSWTVLSRIPHSDQLAIRLPLTAAKGVGHDDARAILIERLRRPFSSLEDLYRRVSVSGGVLEALCLAGALESFGPRRDLLWQLGVLDRKLGTPGLEAKEFAAPPLLETSLLEAAELARLAPLTPLERSSWDYRATGGTTGPHPIAFGRPDLTRAGVQRICDVNGERAVVAGVVVARQRPMTARGLVFITLEDETSRIQCVVYPQIWERLEPQLRGNALILGGSVQRVRAWVGLTVDSARRLEATGGRAGGPRA